MIFSAMAARLKIAERVIHVHPILLILLHQQRESASPFCDNNDAIWLPAGPGSSKAEGRKGAAALSLVGLAGVNCQTPS